MYCTWTPPIWKTIKLLTAKHNIPWLRVSMSYHRFPNLRELLNGDLTQKLTQNVPSLDFDTLACNCNTRNTTGCAYNNVCRQTIGVYQIECNLTGKLYIGCTQTILKKRMKQHFVDAKKLHEKGLSSSSYARHFAYHLQRFPIINPALQRSISTYSFLWQGKPLSTVKTFATPTCILCNKERLEIFKLSRTKPHLMMNSCNELFGACRHKPHFHRYRDKPPGPSTDES